MIDPVDAEVVEVQADHLVVGDQRGQELLRIEPGPLAGICDMIGPLPDQPNMHLDRGYDSTKTRDLLEILGYEGHIAAKGVPAPERRSRPGAADHGEGGGEVEVELGDGGMSNPSLPHNRILIGDAVTQLRALPPASVDCIITSPPYFGLRDYGHDGQLGAERHIGQWVLGLRAVARELARVLKPGGVFWLNVGDTYSRRPDEGAVKKSMLLGPQRLALALLADGWLLRNQVIWAKTNPMPESIRDRLANRHEMLFLLTRQRDYFFDLDAIREPHQAVRKPLQGIRKVPAVYPPPDLLSARDTSRAGNSGLKRMLDSGRVGHPLGKNPSDVWTMATASYRGAHFATFPLELIRRPLLATCPAQVCAVCGTPWRRGWQRLHGRRLASGALRPACDCHGDGNAVSQPGVVLDPFLGSGTVALAAECYGRDWVGIELNPAYAALAERRLAEQRSAREKAATSKEKQKEAG